MKRILVIAAVVLGLGAIGLTAAHADNTGASTHCTNGAPNETDVPNGFVGLSYEYSGSPTNPGHVQVCYSTTPNGSSSPEAAGGKFVVYNPQVHGQLAGECGGDRSTSQTAAVDCDVKVTPTDPSSAPGTTATGSAKVGATGPVNVGQTGVEVSPATSLNSLGGATPGTGGSAGLGSGTCTWVNGTTSCPLGGITVADVTVHESDLVPVVTTYPASPPCTGINNTCVPVGATVEVFDDTSNPTVSVKTPTSSTPTTANAPRQCVQVNATCPP